MQSSTSFNIPFQHFLSTFPFNISSQYLSIRHKKAQVSGFARDTWVILLPAVASTRLRQISPTRWWPWLLIWALLLPFGRSLSTATVSILRSWRHFFVFFSRGWLSEVLRFLSYVLQKPAMQAARHALCCRLKQENRLSMLSRKMQRNRYNSKHRIASESCEKGRRPRHSCHSCHSCNFHRGPARALQILDWKLDKEKKWQLEDLEAAWSLPILPWPRATHNCKVQTSSSTMHSSLSLFCICCRNNMMI